MEIVLNREQKEVVAKEIRAMTQTRAWRTLLDRLGQLSKHKEMELGNNLRKFDFNKVLYLRGLLDGVELVEKEADRMSRTDNPEQGE